MRFYRYQPINPYSIENLKLRKNWASTPKDFNDPFEFPLKSYNFNGNKVEPLSNVALILRDKMLKYISQAGVISYSTNYENTLMWSHYANHHKGMCLCFEVEDTSENHPMNVIYRHKIPHLDFVDHEDFTEVLVTKNECWNYENEFRQVFKDCNKHYDYPGKLKEIVFGCQASTSDIGLIMKIGETIFNNEIVFSKMFMVRDTFNLGSATIEHKIGDPVPKWCEFSIM